MSFHLSQTPTLEAVATDDEKLLTQDLQARVEEGVARARAVPEVAEAIEAQTAAEAHLAKMRAAERGLNQQSKEAHERAAKASQTVLDLLVESATGGAKPEWRKVGELALIEDRIRYTGRAIERLTEHLIPLALIASLREEAHALLAESRAVERVAQERAEALLGKIREAVTDEMVLPVDLSKGVAGALLARARALKARAVQVSENADQLERTYQDRCEA